MKARAAARVKDPQRSAESLQDMAIVEQESVLTNWIMRQDASIWLATGSKTIPRSNTVNFCMAGKYCSLICVFSTTTIP